MLNVLVTGGSRGIGLAISQRLADAGYNVIAVARRESDGLREAIAAGANGGGRLHFRAADLSNVDAIPAFVKGLREEFGAIYGLINNAGIGTEGLLATMHNSEIEALMRLNVLSPVILTKYVVRHMMADGAGGRVINMSSIIASTGYNGLSVYGATKAALTGFTRSLAREVGKLGITVNAIAPGFVDTELTENLAPEQRQRIAGRSALRRLPEADDVARMVEYLLGDGGRNVTGAVLTVDAGNTA
jgi:3-oxoacyl-[acyl-carrier protein] reductase